MIAARSLVGVDVDVEFDAQQVDAGLGDLLAHEDSRAAAHVTNVAWSTSRCRHYCRKKSTLQQVKYQNCESEVTRTACAPQNFTF